MNETKYKVGQKVWLGPHGRGVIRQIGNVVGGVQYYGVEVPGAPRIEAVSENNIWPSRQKAREAVWYDARLD